MTEVRLRIRSIKRKGERGILELKIMLEKLLQKTTLLCRNKSCSYCDDDYREGCDSTCVPEEDVKEGHFAVIAEDGVEGPERFIVPLSCLNNPAFFRMLEKAAEEYGFDQVGVLTIPCSPSELEMLLAQQWHSEAAG